METEGIAKSATPGSKGPDRVNLQTLAARHVEVQQGGSAFLDRRAVDALQDAFTRLGEAFRRGPREGASIRVAGEWLLDNDYLIRRALGQLRHELPAGFQGRLPQLVRSGRPRALELAEAIYDQTAHELVLEEIERFLESYQQIAGLTIAELWALPALLRFVILQNLRAVLDYTLDEERPVPLPVARGLDVGTASGQAVRSLRLLAEVDWKQVFSRRSETERMLGEDPAGVYATMDFETRDAYRRSIEEIALAARHAETEVAQAVLDLAGAEPPDGPRGHVGYWLFGPGRSSIEESLGASSRGVEHRLLDHPRLAFFGLLVAAQIGLLAPVVGYLLWLQASLPISIVALLLVWIPSSVPAETLVRWLLSRLVRPRLLPKLDFSEGVPQRWRTLIAVPTLLGRKDEIDALLSELEVHYLANPDPQFRFALLTDHPDSDAPPGETHDARLAHTAEGIRRLNERYGGTNGEPFHLLHRDSRWNVAEDRWMGWERKRGKIEELNRYLGGDADTGISVHVGDPDGLRGVAFVITLDADTQLPSGAAARLAGALAHPLNRPITDSGDRVAGGYTVIQPRVEISPRAARRSVFTRLFSGDTGIDIYTRAVSEVYQDLFGEGIYVGKGIYDVDAFRRSLNGRVPENTLLSHDLFEGVHGRAALATDIVVYEDYPSHYPAYLQRMHRWIRGDWQLLRWLLPRVPNAKGGTTTSPLSLLDRFKIGDNLRRSLLAPAVIGLLLSGWTVLPGHPLFWTLAALLAPGAAAVWSMLRGGTQSRRELGRWFLALAFAPQEALTALDAVARVCVRMLWTRRGMLEWTTAAEAARMLQDGTRARYFRRLWAGPAAGFMIAGILALFTPASLVWASPWLLLWLASPELAWRISRPGSRTREALEGNDLLMLRHLARRTWLFFETFVGPGDNWLPPDHFQEFPRRGVAHRTSPTNIGMLLLSQLAAYDLGYIGQRGLALWVGNTLDTLERLQRHRGHLYNWYDTRTLEPLEPRYVSTVDSGNLAGALLAVATGCERAIGDPPFRPELSTGLRDAAELLTEAVEGWMHASPSDGSKAALAASRAIPDLVGRAGPPNHSRLDSAIEAVRSIEAGLLSALDEGSVSHDPSLLRELRTWLDRFANQLDDARDDAERLAPAGLDPVLSNGEIGLDRIPAACERASRDGAGQGATLDQVAREASALSTRLTAVAQRARAIVEAMELRFLYDVDRRLFHVGYNVTTDRLDPHHYDLLASEARLASFLAIVRRQVPVEHWFALGRPLVRTGRGGRALLSWGGSMFEYLMPHLLMESHEGTFLFQSSEEAVERQIDYGREKGTPWGISESGYAFLDGQQAYQYRAFGVPGLGLRRGLEEDLVVAPYASLLALRFRPDAVVENLARLVDLGAAGEFGFYEAVDFHPQRATRDRPTIVRSYMAHHHGMSLVAIDNYLTRDVMPERFHSDPRVRSGALLLDERVPVEMPIEQLRSEAAGTTDVALTPQADLPGWAPGHARMEVWAMGNGALTSFVSTSGAGGLRWRDLTLTRWEPDSVRERLGSRIWLWDTDRKETIGVVPDLPGHSSTDAWIRFEAGFVEFHRRQRDLAIRMRVTVAPGEDVEVREIEVSNQSGGTRRIRVAGSIEPVLEPDREAERHPAFSKLFLRCSPVEKFPGIVVSRLNSEQRAMPLLLFRIVGETATAPRLAEIDREAFLGRNGSLTPPRGVTMPAHEPAKQTLDPLCVCTAELVLGAGETQTVSFVTAVATARPDVLDLGHRFGSPAAVRWVFEDASHATARRVERLGMPKELLPQAQRLLSALLIPDPRLRAPEGALATGRPGQRRLWGRGISGDEPIVLVRIDSTGSTQLLAEVLALHRYLRALGVRIDVVLVDDAPSGYAEHGAESLRRVLAEHDAAELLHQHGGVHVVSADQATEGELVDLAASARVFLDRRQGSLAEQLAARENIQVELPRFEPAGLPPQTPPDPELALVVPPLAFDNSFGGFDGDEYVVRPGTSPPAPWANVIANEQFGCLVSEAALGSSWSMNAGENRLTPWHNDPVLDPPSEVFYLRDEETARVWTTTPQPAGLPTLVRHGQGYTVYQSVTAALELTMTVFVPPDLPSKIVRLHVRNAAARPRRLTATYYAEWVLGTKRSETRPYILPGIAAGDSCLFAETYWKSDFAGRVAFLGSDRPPHGYTTDRVEMLGLDGNVSQPPALGRWGLTGRVAPGLDPCAALQVHIDLGPEGETELSFFLGQETDRESALALVRRLRAPGAVEEAWRACRQFWDNVLGAVRVSTPDAALDRISNRWLLYQSLSSRFFARTAFYQSSGAYGFRDQLQDALAFVHCRPELTRRHLLEAAAHQFASGDVLHWWHPPRGAGVRTRCSDDFLWLAYATADYVAATGDADVLDEPILFLAGEPLGPDEEIRYGYFERREEGTLLEHCRRAVAHGFTTGSHGLPLIGTGDWNDGMNRLGTRGRGESVWLGWFLYACTERLASLVERKHATDEARSWRERLPALAQALSEHGWDGKWYRRAYDDDGSPIGSADSPPPHIDSIAQSWAVLSGAGEPQQAAEALASAERMLVREDDRLVLLLTPPFGPSGRNPGYISAYPPGVRENGGQYTHAAAWLGWAHAAIGNGSSAHRIFGLINPLERTQSPENVGRYRVEPYVLAGDVYAHPSWVGRGGWTWYTGAAAWTWRLAIEGILGLRRRNGALSVEPSIPERWTGFEAKVREGDLTVHVVVHNEDGKGGGILAARLDGCLVERACVELKGKGERRLEIWLGDTRRRVEPEG